MKFLTIAALFMAFFFTTAPSLADEMAKKEMVEKSPKIIAVLNYASWCGTCKTLDPLIEEARVKGALDTKDVLFVTMDYSDEASTAQSEKLATALGLSDVFAANNGKTGFMALVNAETHEVVGKIDKSMSVEDISNAITQQL